MITYKFRRLSLGEGNALDDLLREYRISLNLAKKLREEVREEDKKTVSGMISNLQYAFDWLKTGREPGNRRGIERWAGYQREVLVGEVLTLDLIISHQGNAQEIPADPFDEDPYFMARVEDMLAVLSKNQREVCFQGIMNSNDPEDIAKTLGITRNSVGVTKLNAKCRLQDLMYVSFVTQFRYEDGGGKVAV